MSSTKKNYNVFVVSRDENMRFIHEKSINNTCKEIKNSSNFSRINSNVFVNYVRIKNIEHFVCRMIWYFRLYFSSRLIRTSICFDTKNSFDETTMTIFQMNATKMFMQIVIETKNSKTTTTCMKIDFFD